MSEKKVCDPAWWRLGWVPYVVLVLVAAAADLCFPVLQSSALRYLGVGASVGVLLFMTALLLLRRDFFRTEQLFLGGLALVGAAALLVCGSHVGWVAALTLPFFVLVFNPGRPIPLEEGAEYRTWWGYWRDQRRFSNAGKWRAILPTLISILVGIICFIAFLCIFASGNPVVQLVWDTITTWWNRIMEYLQISWDFWAHALVWAVGLVSFGIFTVQRMSRPLVQVPAAEASEETPAGRSMLPHLPLMVLLGVNLAFLIATSTDVAFLWFQRVPEGVSQTDYLYEGAASIVWASLLAVVLLVYLFRRRGSVRRTVVARGLGFVLVAQTFLLAVSVYVRLYNQIAQYAFTPKRILACEFMLLGVAGLVILLCYMCSKAGILRYTRLCAGCLGLLGLVFTINPPASLAGDLNLRYAASNPQWTFSTSDFKSGCFNVYDYLAFATYVYELEKQKCGDLNDEALDSSYRRSRVSFESRIKHAASMVEDRNRSWTLFTLRSCWDRPAAEYVLGRPIGEKKVEETH